MRPESTPADGAVALASGAAGAAGQTESILPGVGTMRPRLAPFLPARLRTGSLALGRRAGLITLGLMVVGAVTLVAFASARGTVLVPRSTFGFPAWEAGPLHYLFGRPKAGYYTLIYALSGFFVLMTLAYAAALLAVRSLSMRAIVVAVVALHVVLLAAPPMQLTDLFNYLGYARLGAVHHLNPYVHTIRSETFDPVYTFTTWHNLKSPYGPLFTAITYPIALLPLPAAYWVLKTMVVGLSLAFIALVYKCARMLGRDPRFAVAFVALNPIYLFYAVGSFHNDFFMLVPSTAAILLLLQHRDRSAGAVLMIAVAVKFTAILLLPFLLVAAIPPQRRLRIVEGAALAIVPLVATTVALFGFSLPNLSDQSTLLTNFSIPNLVGLMIGAGGGTPGVLRLADVALIPTVIFFLYRRNGDWISRAGWATLALMCTLSWLVPWYVVWLLPLAALGQSVRLRRAAVVFTVFLLFSFMPTTELFLVDHGDDPLGKAVQQTRVLQAKLEANQ
ncbi:MAG: glycosyltransferase family 87 protein [Solirubrobacteraceae bacterium]